MGDLELLSEPIFTSLGGFTGTGFFCSFSTTSTFGCSEDMLITDSVVLHCDSETRSVREPRQSKSDCFQMNYENPARRERERGQREWREARELLYRLALLSAAGRELFVSDVGTDEEQCVGRNTSKTGAEPSNLKLFLT